MKNRKKNCIIMYKLNSYHFIIIPFNGSRGRYDGYLPRKATTKRYKNGMLNIN